nr:MAG TPA: hypothetical protein [Caudoviricetes sp.]
MKNIIDYPHSFLLPSGNKKRKALFAPPCPQYYFISIKHCNFRCCNAFYYIKKRRPKASQN